MQRKTRPEEACWGEESSGSVAGVVPEVVARGDEVADPAAQLLATQVVAGVRSEHVAHASGGRAVVGAGHFHEFITIAEVMDNGFELPWLAAVAQRFLPVHLLDAIREPLAVGLALVGSDELDLVGHEHAIVHEIRVGRLAAVDDEPIARAICQSDPVVIELAVGQIVHGERVHRVLLGEVVGLGAPGEAQDTVSARVLVEDCKLDEQEPRLVADRLASVVEDSRGGVDGATTRAADVEVFHAPAVILEVARDIELGAVGARPDRVAVA